MDTEVRKSSLMYDEFAKFAHETVDMLRERAVEFESHMASVMADSGNIMAAKFGERGKLGEYIESNPRRAAAFAFMTGMMMDRMTKAWGIKVSFEKDSEAMKSGATTRSFDKGATGSHKKATTSKSRMTAKRKAA